jgi:hypothetical protein
MVVSSTVPFIVKQKKSSEDRVKANIHRTFQVQCIFAICDDNYVICVPFVQALTVQINTLKKNNW